MGKSSAPPYEKIDVPALTALAQQYAREGYAWSDADQAARHPEFAPGLDYSINSARTNLRGGMDPQVAQGLRSAGLGVPDLGGNEFEKARNLGQPILAQEQRDRNYFQRLLSQPAAQPRGDLAGLSGKNIAEIRAVESGNKISYDWANFGTKINQANAMQTQANALGQAWGRTAGGVAQAGLSSLNNRPAQSIYLDPNTYNYQPAGGYYNPGFAPSNYGGAYEGQISGQPVYRATPVDASGGGGGGF